MLIKFSVPSLLPPDNYDSFYELSHEAGSYEEMVTKMSQVDDQASDKFPVDCYGKRKKHEERKRWKRCNFSIKN